MFGLWWGVLFFFSEQRFSSCQNACDALHCLLDNIFIQFGSNLCRQVVCIPVDTNCAPLVAGMFCFVVREAFGSDWADVIESFGSTSGFLMVCLMLIILIWNKW